MSLLSCATIQSFRRISVCVYVYIGHPILSYHFPPVFFTKGALHAWTHLHLITWSLSQKKGTHLRVEDQLLGLFHKRHKRTLLWKRPSNWPCNARSTRKCVPVGMSVCLHAHTHKHKCVFICQIWNTNMCLYFKRDKYVLICVCACVCVCVVAC